MKNYWQIYQDHLPFECLFVLNKNEYDIDLIKELLRLTVLEGEKYGIIKILDQESGEPYGDEFLKMFNTILEKKGDVNALEKYFSFFQQAFPRMERDYRNPHVIVSEIFFYNINGEIEKADVFRNDIFYPLLNPYRVHLYHSNETGTYSPMSIELAIGLNRELRFRIASGLGIWLPYFGPDIDSDYQSLNDFPINENGYIDNRELYLLNTPRLLGFVKEIRKFFARKNGKEIANIANSDQFEKFPEFPWFR